MSFLSTYYLDIVVTVLAAVASAATAAAIAVAAPTPTVALPLVAASVLVAMSAARISRIGRRSVLMARRYVPAIAILTAVLGAAMAGPLPWLGRAAFVLAAASVAAMRRAGGQPGAVATLATGPLAAAVAVPLPAGSASVLVTALFAAVLLAATAWAAGLTALARRLVPRGDPTPAPARSAQPAPDPSELVRQAAAVGLGVGLAFVFAALVLPAHLAWAPLTALVVGARAETWHDTAHLGLRRLGGAMAGAVLATLALLVPHGRIYPVVLAAVVMVGATWLRPAGYAWWAGGLTAALVLLAGDSGQAGGLDLSFAVARIAAIAAGGVLAIAAAWGLLPRPAVEDPAPDDPLTDDPVTADPPTARS
ncbi:MAG TPA: FUSC family protein [Pseudonocardia sp.]|nr:FUSC family protein [Pseudonocardia sp.]